MRKQINMTIRGLLILFFLAVVPTTHSTTLTNETNATETNATPVQQRKLTIDERLNQAKQSLDVDDDVLLNLHKHDETLYCMAQAAFFEAGNESFKGKVAVSEVIMNRMESGKFPSDACGVVRQSTRVSSGTTKTSSTKVCQFSWVCTRKGTAIPLRDNFGRIRPEVFRQWKESVIAATIVYNRMVVGVVEGAVFFFNKTDSPRHWRALRRVERIGNHTFYRAR